MNISVTKSKVAIEKESLNKGEYNVRECNFTFSEEYEGLILKALFTIEDTKLTYEQAIVNNKCAIPYEATVSKSKVTLGVIGYNVENEELVKRYSPAPDVFFVYEGSYIEDIENQSTPTPTQLDQLDQRVSDLEVEAQQIDINKQDIADIKLEQIIQNNAIETNTGNISDLTTRVGSLETDNTINKQDISNIKQEQIVQNTAISNKVDKVAGKGLSTKDYTTEEKEKLAEIEAGAEVNIIETVKVNNSTLPVNNKAVNITMPTKVSDLSNDSGFITKDVDNLTNYTKTGDMTSAINTAVGNETTERQGADTALQTQIDAITSASDVVDVVGTYAELQSYDTTKLTANDVVKVLQDSTHNNALSYYRWASNSWNYIGSEGPFYTRGETDTLLNAKQDEIDNEHKLNSDLVDDTNSNNKFVTTTEKTNWNGKYEKPSGGIPSTDLADSVLADYVKNTDYATNQKGGVLRISGNYGARVNAGGDLFLVPFTYPQYQNTYDNSFIGKGTLENVIAGKLYTQEQINASQTAQDELIAELQEQYNAMLRSRKYTIGNGENVTLQNTAEGVYFRKLGIGGNSWQATQSANLFDPNKYKNATYSTGTYNYTPLDIAGNRTLYFKGVLKSGKTKISNLVACITSNGGNPNSGTTAISVLYGNTQSQSKDFTGINDLYFSYYPTDLDVNDIFETYDLMVSTNDVDYVPFVPNPSPIYPQQIHNVSGNAVTKVMNKNLFNKTTCESGKYINANGEIATYQSYSLSDYIRVKPSTHYVYSGVTAFSERSAFYDKNKQLISVFTLSALTQYQYFDTPANCEYVRITVINNNVADGYIDKFQLEQNPTATTYTPHAEQTFTLPVQQPMRSIGTTRDCFFKNTVDSEYYNAELTENAWYERHIIGNVVLDGSEDEGLSKLSGRTNVYGTNLIANNAVKPATNSLIASILCSSFEVKPWYNVNLSTPVYQSQNGIAIDKDGGLWLGTILVDSITDLTTLKTWLSTHNVTVNYIQLTPTYIPCTQAQVEVLESIQKAMSYYEQTNISGSSDDVSPVYDVEGYQDMNLI